MNVLKMKNRYEQVQVISEDEMRNRISDLRKIMEKHDCDMMLVLDGSWEGYSHWITGSRSIETAMIFPKGKIIAVYTEDMRGIPYEDAVYEHIHYLKKLDFDVIENDMPQKKHIRIAIVQPEALTYALDQQFRGQYTSVEYVNCTQEVDVRKSIKSEVELKWIQEANRVHELIFQALPSIISEGKTIRDINCETRYLGEKLGGGGEKALYYAMQYGSDNGEPLIYASGLSADSDYRVKKGDRIFMMAEGNACGGLYTALGRNFILGEPSKQTVEYWEMAVKAQDFAAAMMKPGVKLKDIFDANYQFIESNGYLTNMQNYLHSFGYVFGERPYLHDRSECEELQIGMHYIVHPHIRIDRKEQTGKVPYDDYYSVDTYYVSETGGIRANNYPRKLVIL